MVLQENQEHKALRWVLALLSTIKNTEIDHNREEKKTTNQPSMSEAIKFCLIQEEICKFLRPSGTSLLWHNPF